MYCKICGQQIDGNVEICNECMEKRKKYMDSKTEHESNTNIVSTDYNGKSNTNDFSNNNLNVSQNIENKTNQNLGSSNEVSKKENLKVQIIKYILPIYLCSIILVFMAYSTSFRVDTSGTYGGFNMLGHVFIWGIVIVLVLVILSIVLSKKNIKNNYDNLQNGDNKKIIINTLNSLLLYNVITTIICKFLSIFLVNYNLYDLYYFYMKEGIKIFFAPILIPITKFLNKDNYVSKDSVNKIVFLLYIMILVTIYRFNIMEWIINIVFMLPFTIIGLQNNSNNVKKIEKKDIISLIVFVVIFIVLIFGFNSVTNKIYMNPTKANPSENVYCMIPFKTQNNYIYYSASKAKECFEAYPDLTVDVSKSLYRLDDELNINAIVSGIRDEYHLGVYEFPTEKLYFNMNIGGALYETTTDNKYKKVVGGNISILGYHNNEIYYESYSKNSIEKLNLTSYKKTKVKNIKNIGKIISGYKNVLIYKESNSNDVYEYNLDTHENRKIDSFHYGTYYEKDNKLYTVNYDKIIIYDMKTKEIKEITTKENDNGRQKICGDDDVILGIYNHDLYYVDYEYSYYIVEKMNLETGVVNSVLSAKFDEYGSYLKEKGRNLVLLKENSIYYSDSNNSGKIYRMDLSNNTKEEISDYKNSIVFDVIDGYVYYTSYDNNTKKNSFWRIKDNKEEAIIK